MGALLHRYWHSVAAVAELDDAPTKPLRLLREDLVSAMVIRGQTLPCAQAQRGPLLRSLTSVREPIESGAAILATHLLLAEFSERITAIATLTIDPLMLAEPSERITAIATTIADMLLRA
jgi:hypothetical protein